MPRGTSAVTGFLVRHRDRAWLVLAVLAILLLHIYAFGNTFAADDAWFSRALEQRSLWEFMAWRYDQWSGRLPIEAALVLLVNHAWAWKLINGLMWLLFCYSAGKIALAGRSAASSTALAFVALMLISPRTLYAATWWITGSVNYLWPTALGLYGMLAYVDPDGRGNLSRLGCLLAAGLAMYNEQVAFVLLPAALVSLSFRIARRKLGRWDVAQLAFMVANAATVLAAPGSRHRYLSEQALRFPDFAMLDVFDKVAIGLGLVFRSVVDPGNLMIAAMVIVVAGLLLRAPVDKAGKLMVFTALGFLAIGYVLAFPGLPRVSALRFYTLPPIDGESAAFLNVYVLSAWSAFVVACVVAAAVAASWRSLGESLGVFTTLVLGMGSLGALGFSPTAYASGDRIAFVCQVAFLLVVLRLTVAVEREYGPFAVRAGIGVAAITAGYRVMRLLPL